MSYLDLNWLFVLRLVGLILSVLLPPYWGLPALLFAVALAGTIVAAACGARSTSLMPLPRERSVKTRPSRVSGSTNSVAP